MSCGLFEQPDKMIKAEKYLSFIRVVRCDVIQLNIHWELIPCAISSYGKGSSTKWLYLMKKLQKGERKAEGQGEEKE